MRKHRPVPAFYHISDPDDYFVRIRSLTDHVLQKGAAKLAPELKETSSYLNRAKKQSPDELTPLSPTGDLILAMLSVEILNRDWRTQFLSSRLKIVLTPHCMNLKKGKCEAELDPETGLFLCQSCSEDCATGEITRLYARRDDVRVLATKDRTQSGAAQDFTHLFEVLQVGNTSIGVLGIACLIELSRGMITALDAGVPPQGIPLLYPGCYRWSPDHFFLTHPARRELVQLLPPSRSG